MFKSTCLPSAAAPSRTRSQIVTDYELQHLVFSVTVGVPPLHTHSCTHPVHTHHSHTPFTHTHTYTHIHTHTHAHTHTHTHTHTDSCRRPFHTPHSHTQASTFTHTLRALIKLKALRTPERKQVGPKKTVKLRTAWILRISLKQS